MMKCRNESKHAAQRNRSLLSCARARTASRCSPLTLKQSLSIEWMSLHGIASYNSAPAVHFNSHHITMRESRALLVGSIDPWSLRFPTDSDTVSALAQSNGSSSSSSSIVYSHNDAYPLISLQEYFQRIMHSSSSGNDIDQLTDNPMPSHVSVAHFLVAHLLMLLHHLSLLLVELSSVCSATTCPSMIATADWEFLCATHQHCQVHLGPVASPNGIGASLLQESTVSAPPASRPRKCSAIDYTLHTLTQTQQLVVHSSPEALSNQLPSVYRRLWRIVLHSYFHHPQQLKQHDAQYNTSRRFHALLIRYKLMTKEQMVPAISWSDDEADTQQFNQTSNERTDQEADLATADSAS